jgi:hypothetical protein
MRRLAVLIAALGLVLVAGCASKGKSSTTGTTAATTGTTGLGIATTTTPNFSGSKNSKYCTVARQFSSVDVSKLSSDPRALFQTFDSLASQFQSVVPSEIKADADTVINAIKQLETAVKAVNYDFTKVDPKALAPIQDPKFTAATNRIDAYDTQVCGLTTSTT